MKRLPAVENARAVMKEGMEWGVWKWLTEKKRVRGLADEARTALDALEVKVKDNWPNEYKIAYNHLVEEDETPKRGRTPAKGKKNGAGGAGNPKIEAIVKAIKLADDLAYNAHEDAEDVFAEAERKMSTGMAREGARMALVAYDRHEEAIHKAEALTRTG